MIRCKFSALPGKNKNHNSKGKIKIVVGNNDQKEEKIQNKNKNRKSSNMLDDLDANIPMFQSLRLAAGRWLLGDNLEKESKTY